MKSANIVLLIMGLLLASQVSQAEYRLTESSLVLLLPGKTLTVRLPGGDYRWRHTNSGHDDEKRSYFHIFESEEYGLTVIANLSEAECPDIESCHASEREIVESYRNDALQNALHLGSVSDIEDSAHGDYLVSRFRFKGYTDLVGATTLYYGHAISFIVIANNGNITDPLGDFLDLVVIKDAP